MTVDASVRWVILLRVFLSDRELVPSHQFWETVSAVLMISRGRRKE